MPGLYNLKAWHQLRARQLRLEPCCRFCRQAGRVVPATVVDHIEPHRGDMTLFLDPQNLQSLCKSCHDSVKQAAEKRGGLARGADLDGIPLDPRHPWNRSEGLDE